MSIGEEIAGLSCFRLSRLDLSFRDIAPPSGDFPLISPMILFAETEKERDCQTNKTPEYDEV